MKTEENASEAPISLWNVHNLGLNKQKRELLSPAGKVTVC